VLAQVLWKAYIDMEAGEGRREATRALYERLLERTGHVKVWLSYAGFEATPLAQLTAEDGDQTCAAPSAASLLSSPRAMNGRQDHRRSLP
jgi:crooked neck